MTTRITSMKENQIFKTGKQNTKVEQRNGKVKQFTAVCKRNMHENTGCLYNKPVGLTSIRLQIRVEI